MTRRRKGPISGIVLIGVVAASLFAAAPASAASEHFFSGGLSPGRAFASTSAHSGVYYVQAIAANTKCPAISQGAAGYYYPGPGNYTVLGPCAQGTTGYYPSDEFDPAFVHGTVYNNNTSTNVSVSDAHYSW